MRALYYEVKKLPVVILDGFYTDDELKLLHEEITQVHDSGCFLTPDLTGSDERTGEGGKIYKRKNLCVQVDTLYTEREKSSILSLNRKVFSQALVEEVCTRSEFFRYLEVSNKDITKLHYYAGEDYYEPHRDISVITTMFWLYNTPKQFSGGELVIAEELKIEPTYNRMVLLPSILSHSVEPVKILPGQHNYPGRYSLTQFIGFQ